jgi:DNA-binding LacI/PurR family transcriptional regulator
MKGIFDFQEITMLPLPRRHSLIAETAAVLRQRIEAGEWPLHLPGELDLAALLQVGRNTVRSALAILESEGYLATANGARRRITKPSHAAPSGKNAVILMSRPERDFPPATAQWIEGTRARLESSGWILRVSIEPEIYRGAPAARLEKMTQSQPGTTWILHRSTPAMQRWFQDRGERTVLAGSRHEGIHLPRVEIDYRAVSRHAAGRLLARGHERLAILRPAGPFAGDAECAAAFREGAGSATVLELHCRPGADGVIEALRPLTKKNLVITALYVLHADHCVTALSFLQHAGLTIPDDISLICREDAPYLSLLCPEPARYRHSTATFSSRLASLVRQFDDTTAGKRRPALIMPSSIEGATLARVRK